MKTVISRQHTVDSWELKLFVFVFSLITVYCLLSTVAFAQTEYELLAPLPGYVPTTAGKTTAGPYIKGIFTLIIAVAGGLAVIKIIFGGIKYMSTDAFEGKSEAKTTIQNAIWGLLLAISAWLILFTVNPKLVEFNLSIPVQPITPSTTTGTAVPGSCQDCVVLNRVPFKLPMISATECGRSGGCGCAYPGPCKVNSALNDKLIALRAITQGGFGGFLVTESSPPTRNHADPCHYNGTCVDVTSPVNIKDFINKVSSVGLRAEFEVESEARAQAIRATTGLSSTQVKYVPGITGEHYSIYMN